MIWLRSLLLFFALGSRLLSVRDKVIEHTILASIDLGSELLTFCDRVREALLLKGCWHSNILKACGTCHRSDSIKRISTLLISLLATVSRSASRDSKFIST